MEELGLCSRAREWCQELTAHNKCQCQLHSKGLLWRLHDGLGPRIFIDIHQLHGWGWGSIAEEVQLASSLPRPQPAGLHSMGPPLWYAVCGSNGVPNLGILEERTNTEWVNVFTEDKVKARCAHFHDRMGGWGVIRAKGGYIEGRHHNH